VDERGPQADAKSITDTHPPAPQKKQASPEQASKRQRRGDRKQHRGAQQQPETTPEPETASVLEAAPKPETAPEPLDLLAYDSEAALAALPLDRLKGALLALGMKCGGTAAQRAARLWAVRGVALADIPPQLLAAKSKGKGKGRGTED